jgi:hypothetical protein
VKNIASHTRGMIFLGTPHKGSDLAKWARIGLQFLKLDNNSKATRDINILKKESSKLCDLSTVFGMFLRVYGELIDFKQKIKIVCFYEEFKTRVANVNIDKVSSYIVLLGT